MISLMQPFMDVESSRSYIDELYSTEPEKCLEAIILLKNSVIGSNRQKGNVISLGVVPRMLQIIESNLPTQVKVEATVILGSLAKGTEDHVKALVEMGTVPTLLNCLKCRESKLEEACLACLRTIFQYPCAPVNLVYQQESLPNQLLTLVEHSISNQVAVASILTASCKTRVEQNVLFANGAVQALAALLDSPHDKVRMPVLRCLGNLCFQNQEISLAVAKTSHQGKSIPDMLINLMGRDKPTEMQLAAARCVTYIHRAGALTADDPKILYRTLPCLVRLCKKELTCSERAAAAETLAYLTEVDTELQRLASISDHLVPTLAELLRLQPEQESKRAAFRAFASLGANDEDIRKRIIETDNLMEHVVTGLSDSNSEVRLAAVRCLHSLSRSVQQLRTTFQDHLVWRPLMHLLHGGDGDVLTVASSTLCNLLLEFSPSKEPILEAGAIELLCGLTRREEPALRLNGIWALMNMAFQAEQKIKSQILATLGTDQIFRLLSDPEVDILMKTLGLLRNLLSTKPHIDYIMSLHGTQVMQAVILILEGLHCPDVKEQALCILANIADGDIAKEHIMSNDDVLKKLMDYMMHSNVKLQMAAIFCVSNLVWREESGSEVRQAKLRELGFFKILQQLVVTDDSLLFDKVKTAMNQFSDI